MHVDSALQQLLHIQLDLGYRQSDLGIVEEAAQVVIHVRKDHVDTGAHA